MSNSPILNIPGIENGSADGETLRWEASTGRWEATSVITIDDTDVTTITGGLTNNGGFTASQNGSVENTDAQATISMRRNGAQVLLGQEVSRFNFAAADDTATARNVARIGVFADDNVTNTARGGNMVFYTGDKGTSSGTVERMRIDSAGNVGIGTSATLVYGGRNLTVNDGIALTGLSRGWYLDAKKASDGLTIGARISSDTADSDMVTITSAGNVGIGITSPNAALEVTRSGVTGQLASFEALDQSFCNVWFSDTSSSNNRSNYIGSIGDVIRFGTNSAQERMRIDASGNLLVGTTTDRGTGRVVQAYGTVDASAPVVAVKSSSLNGAGQHFFQAYSNGAGAATGNGAIVGAGASALQFAAFSDAGIKENITPLGGELANILALKPCSFDFTDREGGGIGFVAQELEEVYPEDVILNEECGLLMVGGWSKTEARLVKAIQEQQAMLTELHAEVQELKGV